MVFRKLCFKHRYEADQQASPGSPPQQSPVKLIILECKTHKDVKNKLQLFGRAVGSFQERGDVWVMEY